MKLLKQLIRILLAVLFLISCNSDNNIKPAAAIPATWLEEMTISQLQQGYKDGKYTIRQVVADYLIRIEAIDNTGPELNSIIYVNPEAIQIAEELDKELAEGKSRGPLHGVPVLLKDNIDTHDKNGQYRRLTRIDEVLPSERQPGCRQIEGSRSRDNRESQSKRMGQFQIR